MWKDITIRTYQDKLYPILSAPVNGEIDELNQRINILIAFEGKDFDYYDNMKSAEFYALFEKYRYLTAMPSPDKCPQIIEVKGKRFAVDYNPANIKHKLKARDIIDLSTLGKDEKLITENMHRILAAYTVEEKLKGKERMEQWEKEEWFKDCDMQTAWSILSFFFLLLESCSPVIRDYLESQVQQMPKEMEKLYQNLLQQTGDGTLPSTA